MVTSKREVNNIKPNKAMSFHIYFIEQIKQFQAYLQKSMHRQVKWGLFSLLGLR